MSEYQELVQEINACQRCTLAQKRTHAVPGEGSITADIMFIGEAPGYYEDQQGRPFVGRAGQVLNDLLAAIGLKREDVYITNMLKCRPPENRDPLQDEITACGGYLDRQIKLIAPKVIVTLGRFSFGKFFPGEAISKARGTPRKWGDLWVYPIYHPAAVLHNPRLKPALEDDFKRLPELIRSINEPVSQEAEGEKDPQQLSMF